MRARVAAATVLLAVFWTLAAVAQDQFEVATIKPANPAAPRRGRLESIHLETPPGRLTVASATLKELIAASYGVENYQVSGGPSWLDSARFNVEGKAAGNPTREQRLLMLRALLTERFHLTVHRESKEMGAYALEVAFDAMAAAIEDTLGLKLSVTKALVEVVVIDRAERVSEN